MDRNILKTRVSSFTLIEILVVVAILALLLMLTAFTFRGQLSKGKDAKRKADLHKIKIALEEYEKDHEYYPPDLDSLESDYVRQIPQDPTTKQPYEYTPEAEANYPSYYWAFTVLEKEDDSQIIELGCSSGCGPTEEDAEDYNYYITSPNAPNPFYASSGYWGCVGGVCIGIGTNDEGRLECDPNFADKEDCESRCPERPCEPI